MSESGSRNCVRCGNELGDGVRFCIGCGTNNFDPDAGKLASAQFEMDANARKTWWEEFSYWYRYFMSGIRR